MYPQLKLFVGGSWIAGEGSEIVFNPADNSELAELPHANIRILDKAVSSTLEGYKLWRQSTHNKRIEVLNRTASILQENISENALLMTLEQGKPIRESEQEWVRVIETLRWYADSLPHLHDINYAKENAGYQLYSKMQPLGLCLAITPWNFPALLPVRKLAPALAAGCSVILKASEETPGSAVTLVAALLEAGLPDNVVSLVFGDPETISSRLLRDPAVRKCSFTGSVRVGKQLAKISSEGLKRCTFELGGHAPVIVFNDADLNGVIETITPFKYRNSGQACIAPSRFYIQDEIYEDFLEAYVNASSSITIGSGLVSATQMGPMANSRRVADMQQMCADAIEHGSTLHCGGNIPSGSNIHKSGFYWSPTVLSNVPPQSRLMQLEPFGPISAVNSFQDESKMLGGVNSLAYGLASYVFTSSEKTADRMINNIEAGGVAINSIGVMEPETPFGGLKESGYGYEGGFDSMHSYVHKKLIKHSHL